MRLHCQSVCNIRCCPRTALSHYWNVTRKTHYTPSKRSPTYSAVNSNYCHQDTPSDPLFKKSFNNVNSISMRKLFKLFMCLSNIFRLSKKDYRFIDNQNRCDMEKLKNWFYRNRTFLAIILSQNRSYSARKIVGCCMPLTFPYKAEDYS